MVAAVLQFNTGLQDWVFASALAGVAGAVALTCYGAYKEFFQVAPAP
jgi:uncharacterized membrane protein